jgi:hypothetical protein
MYNTLSDGCAAMRRCPGSANVNNTTDSSLSSNGNIAAAKLLQRYNSSMPQMVDLNKLSRDLAKRKRMQIITPTTGLIL